MSYEEDYLSLGTADATQPDVDPLSRSPLAAISGIERTGSVFSLMGCIFIIATFLSSSAFHKPINRLVFYASFGNMMSNVGTLMAQSYIDRVHSSGCQLQGFLIQMFMPADAFWTLAMAVNVYLTFYRKYDAASLRRMEIWYIMLCYGLPFLPALVFIFVSRAGRKMYGDATLWCWISQDFDWARLAAFYVPVWIAIVLTISIYIRAGRDIYQKHRQLRGFSGSHEPLTMDDPASTKTTEVVVTTETAPGAQAVMHVDRPVPRPSSESRAIYSVTIWSKTCADVRETYAHHHHATNPSIITTGPSSRQNISSPLPARIGGKAPARRRGTYEAQNAAWSYTKCAILFFTAILVTWIPSTANRLYSFVHPAGRSDALEVMSALVLPLQGFWNAVIYIVTSWSAVKLFFTGLRDPPTRPKSQASSTSSAASTTFITDYQPRRPPAAPKGHGASSPLIA